MGLRHNHRAQGTGENEWYTPPEILEAARAVMDGFDLDPASSAQAQRAVKAARFLSAEDDGLAHEWPGRVWLNPPYSRDVIGRFAAKLVEEVGAGRTREAITLTHSYTDTAWFHGLASAADAVCFTRGRVRFVSPSGEKAKPTQGQALCYFGPRPEAFAARFAALGLVLQRLRRTA